MPPITTRLRYELDDTGIRRAEAGMRAVDAANRKVAESSSLLSARQDGLTKSINQVGRGFSAAHVPIFGSVAMLSTVGLAIAGVTGFLNATASAAIDFESSFTKIRKTVDGSEQDFQRLEKQLRNLAKITPIPIADILNIGAIGGQLGIASKDIASFTDMVAKMALATNMTAEAAATFLGQFGAVMNIPVNQFRNIASGLAELADKTIATESQIAELAVRISGAAKTVGITSAEVLGFSAALASVGLPAEMAGTAISRVLLEMLKAVEEGKEKLAVFAAVAGQTASQFTQLFKAQPTDAVQAFIKGIAELKASGVSIIPVLEAMELGDVRVLETLLKASQAQAIFADTIDTARSSVEAGVRIEEEFAKQMETTASKMAIAKNNLHDLAIEWGNTFLPAIGGAAPKIVSALETIRISFDTLGLGIQRAIVLVKEFAGVAAIAQTGDIAAVIKRSEEAQERIRQAFALPYRTQANIDATVKWIEDQETNSLSAEEATRLLGQTIKQTGETSQRSSANIDALNAAIAALENKAKNAATKVKTFLDLLRDAGTSMNEVAESFAMSHPVVQVFTLRISGLNDQLAAVNAAIEENARQQRYMQAEIAATQARISSLTEALSKARDRLREFTTPRLVGQGAIEERIFQLEAVLRRMRIAEFTAGAGATPQLTEAMRAALGGIALDQPSIDRALTSLRTRLEDLTADPLRKLREAAEGTSQELTFEEALAGIAATKSQISGLESALASENETLRAQQQALADMAAAAEAMRESAARLTAQIQQAEAQQRMMNDALQMAFKWFGEDRQKMIELGGESEKQAYIIDEKMRAMLMAINAYATGGTSTTLQEVQRLINEAIAFAAQNPIIIYTQLGGELPGGRAAGGGGGGQHGFAVTAGGETQTFGTQGAAEQYYNQQTGGAPFTDDQFVAAFQHGGIVTRPTLGIVGEAGPEAVIPLGQAAMGNITININAQAFMGSRSEARKFAEEIAELLNERQRLRLPTGGI